MLLYWSKINDSLFTLTKCPRIKYTPESIWKTEPVAAAPFIMVVANGVPGSIVELPKSPEDIIWLEVNSSPSKKVCVVLSAVDDPTYAT